ncbi:MAG: NADPH-dependent glutamate synthase [Candidatus Thermoplasmatota archaeon]|nr:NADPH-dependent glutamate synthase [Candidatus Thermoplasmatota archaeon]
MANIIKDRVSVSEQAVNQRVKNFDEVPLRYTEEEAVREAKRCLQCRNSPCTENCPVHVDVRGFVKLLAEGELKKAYLKVKEDSPIPGIVGRVCPQEHQCEGACLLGKMGDAVNIGKLEAFLADWAMENGVNEEFEIKEKEQKVAVIGTGPSGISCAVDLRKIGYKVTMFEALHKAGGVLQYGIPNFRLPKHIVDKELSYLETIGIEIRLDTVVGQSIPFDELRNTYDAVFIGTGAGAPIFLNIEGEKLNRLCSANEFLLRTNLMKAYDQKYDTPVILGKRVGVIGAGNVAMDAARCARRFGAEVHVLYRRTKEHSPARLEELHHALEEGINFKELVSPTRIVGEDGWVKGIELVKMKLGEPDKSGRPRPEKIEGTEFIMDLDTIIMALGTRPNRLFLSKTPELKTHKWGGIIVDDGLMTNIEGTTAGGDAVSGGATVIEAQGEGRQAAKTIHNYLSSKNQSPEEMQDEK